MFLLQASDQEYEHEVTCSYCEVYNELIYDLLVPDSAPSESQVISSLFVPLLDKFCQF